MTSNLKFFIGSSAALEDEELPAGVFRTLCRIQSLCWDENKKDFVMSEPNTMKGLAESLGMVGETG